MVERELEAAGYAIKGDGRVENYDRIFVDDPFGNRVELIEGRKAAVSSSFT